MPFPIASHWNRVYIFNRFRDIRPPKPVRTDTQTDTRSKWFYIPSHAMCCIGQTMGHMSQRPAGSAPTCWNTTTWRS